MNIKILYEDRDLLVIYKPGGMATQTGAVGRPDVVSELRNYLGKAGGLQFRKNSQPENRYGKQGRIQAGERQPYLGIVHRLDQPVEGLLVFAKNPRAAAALSKQLQEGGLNKYYYAAVWGKPASAEGELEDYLYKNAENRAEVVTGRQEQYPQAKPAKLWYRTLRTAQGEAADGTKEPVPYSLLHIRIETGRFHQIRAQMAHAGMPLLGDIKYGTEASIAFSRSMKIKNVALCAYRLSLRYPLDAPHKHLSHNPYKPSPHNPSDRREMNWEIEPGEEIFAGIAVR